MSVHTRALVGNWKSVRSDNIEAVMKEMGANLMLRKFFALSNPEMEVVLDGADITFTMKVGLKKQVIELRIGETRKVDTENNKAKAYTFEDGDELVTYKERDENKDKKLTIRRKIVNGQYLMIMEVRDMEASEDSPPLLTGIRYFERIN